MPLDTRLPLLGREFKPISREDAMANGIKLRDMQRGEQQAVEAQQAQKTLQDLYRQSVGEDGAVDTAKFNTGVAQAGLGDRLPGIQKEQIGNQETQAKTDASRFELAKKRSDAIAGNLGGLLAKPSFTHEDVYSSLNSLVDSGVITQEQGAQAARGLPGKPEALRPFILQQVVAAADGSKRLEALMPKTSTVDTGDHIELGTIDPLTGKRTVNESVQKGVNPSVAATNARITAAGEGSSFTQEEGSLMAALAERGISLPAGMRSRAQMKSTFGSLLARNPGMGADEIAEKIATGQININAERKETTTAAAQAGKVAVAVNELNTFGDQVLDASNAVPRGNFIPYNKLIQMSDQQLSDPALINLKVKMQSLNNAYDSLAARGGTDADKRAHIAQLFNTAASPEAVTALVSALKDEARAAESAARTATKRREPEAPPQQEAPPAAIEYLKAHPETSEAFKAKFGYLPNG